MESESRYPIGMKRTQAIHPIGLFFLVSITEPRNRYNPYYTAVLIYSLSLIVALGITAFVKEYQSTFLVKNIITAKARNKPTEPAKRA